MVSNAISDFHWEVQIAALQFWRVVIKSVLADQGMLDGTFPLVTFSKETRKIVTLNEEEIRKRLAKALEELANIGCLTVLVKLINSEVDVEIMEHSLAISKEILDILKQYNFKDFPQMNGDNTILSEKLDEIVHNDDFSTPTEQGSDENCPRSDVVIEGILNSNDLNLLSNMYERHLKLQEATDEMKVTLRPIIRFRKYVAPKLFLSYISSGDFESVIEENKKWKKGIRSMSSLLDDILGVYEPEEEEVNNMDCY